MFHKVARKNNNKKSGKNGGETKNSTCSTLLLAKLVALSHMYMGKGG